MVTHSMHSGSQSAIVHEVKSRRLEGPRIPRKLSTPINIVNTLTTNQKARHDTRWIELFADHPRTFFP
jgi:hypothetical protein